MFVLNAKLSSIYALILEIFAGLSIVSLSGFFEVFMLKKSGLILATVATVSRKRHLGSFIMSMASSVFTLSCYICSAIIIRVNPHSRNTSKQHS